MSRIIAIIGIGNCRRGVELISVLGSNNRHRLFNLTAFHKHCFVCNEDLEILRSFAFSSAPIPQRKFDVSGIVPKKAAPKEKIHLIDLRRANNTEIMPTKVKMPLPDMVAAILAMDDTLIDSDQVQNCLKFCPTKEEIEQLKNFIGDHDTLGKCEQYLLDLMKVPRMDVKLNVFLFKIQFNTQLSDLKKSLNTLNSVCEEAQKSTKLKEIMKIVSANGDG